MEVYSLSTHSWKSIGVLPPWIISMNYSSGHAVSNGVAYWIMQAEKDYSLHLVSFNTGSEVFEKVLLPEAMWDGLQYYFGGFNDIHVYKESVCFVLPSGRVDHIDIWVLQEKCLHKLHTVLFPGTSPVPLGFKTNDEILLKYRKYGRRYLAIFNLQTKQINESRVMLPVHCYLDHRVDTYVASLLLLKDIRAQELRGISCVFPFMPWKKLILKK
ncbi:hypothetical protein CerSpe_019880 [Prunus speciosa]